MSLASKVLGERKKSRPPVELRVDDLAVSGFASGEVVLTMEQGYNAFSFEYVAETDFPIRRTIYEGDPCEVVLNTSGGPEVIIAGLVDTCEDEDSPDSFTLQVSGKSRTIDLVEGAATFTPGRWSNAKLEKIVTQIASPLSTTEVFVQGEQGEPFSWFSIQKGETAFDAISRAALLRGLHPFAVRGSLVLTRAGATQTATVLERGKGKLVRSRRVSSWANRFSHYLLRAQVRGTDENWGKNAGQLDSAAEDDELVARGRYRPLLAQVEARSRSELRSRAIVERNRRAGRGMVVSTVVDGWETDEGTAWRPNTLVRFVNPVLGVDEDLLITTARFRFGPSEPQQVELEMTRPEAFDLRNYPALKRGQQWT